MDNANNVCDSNESSPREDHVRRHHHTDHWTEEEWPSGRSEGEYSVVGLRVPPAVSHQATQLRHYLTKLQSTIDSIISGSESASESESPVEDLTTQLHDEYQMMSGTLNQLESLLLGQQNISTNNQMPLNRNPNNQMRPYDELGLLDCVVTDRDEVIRRLSERVRTLCRANDQLYMDFEAQEQMLTNEMQHLRRQLEYANHAIQMVACHDCSHEAQDAVHDGVEAMRAAQEQIAELRAQLLQKEHELQHMQEQQAVRPHTIDLRELQRLLQYCLGDLEYGGALCLDGMHSVEDVRGVLERLRAECLRLFAASRETQAALSRANDDASHRAASLAHFLHRFGDQARALMQRLELRTANAPSGHLRASWTDLAGVDVSGEATHSAAGVGEVFEVTLRFVQDLFDFMCSEMQLHDNTAKQLRGQLEEMQRECASMQGRSAQLELWNKDSEDRILQMERDRDEEMDIARHERAEALSRCQALSDHVARLKTELDAERLERAKALREGQTVKDQVDRNLRRSSDFEQRYMASQEEIGHLTLKIKELESNCECLQADLAAHRLREGELAVKVECDAQAAQEANAACQKLYDQVASLQAERAGLEARLSKTLRLEQQLQVRESTESALRGEIALLQKDMEVSRRNSARLLQQQNDEALSTISKLQQELQTAKSELQHTLHSGERQTPTKDSGSCTAASQTDGTRSGGAMVILDSPPLTSQLTAGVSSKTKVKVAAGSEVNDRSSPIIVECSGGSSKSPMSQPVSICSCPPSKHSLSEVLVEMPSPTPLATAVQACQRHLTALLQASQALLDNAPDAEVALNPVISAARVDEALPEVLKPMISDLGQTMLTHANLVAELKRNAGDIEAAHLRVERDEMDDVIQRYEERVRAMEVELNSHIMEHVSVIEELQKGIRVRDSLINKLSDIILDFTVTINDDNVPMCELRLLFSSHTDLSKRVEIQLKELRSNEEHIITSLDATQRDLIDRHHEIMRHDITDDTVDAAGPLIQPIGTPFLQASARMQPPSTPILPTEALLQSAGAPIQPTEALLQSAGAPIQPTTVLIQSADAPAQETIVPSRSLGVSMPVEVIDPIARRPQSSDPLPSRVPQLEDRDLVARLLVMKRKLEDPQAEPGADLPKLVRECLKLCGESIALADSVNPTSLRPLSDDMGPLPSRATSGAESRSKWLLGTESVDLPEAVLSSTQRTTPVEKSCIESPESPSSHKVIFLLKIFDLEKEMRYASLDDKVTALENLAETLKKIMTEVDEWEKEDLEVTISLIESLSRVASLETQKRNLERKFRLSMRQAEKVVKIGMDDGSGYLKKTLLSVSTVCNKSPETRKSTLVHLMQTHVDSMRKVPPHELIVMSSVTDLLKCLLHMTDLETKFNDLEEEKSNLQLKLISNEIVLKNFTQYLIPMPPIEESQARDLISDSSAKKQDQRLIEPVIAIPASTPQPISNALEMLRHLSSQPVASRIPAISQLFDTYCSSSLKTRVKDEKKNFEIAAAMLEVALALDAVGDREVRETRRTSSSSEKKLRSVLPSEVEKVGRLGFETIIDTYKKPILDIPKAKTERKAKVAMHVLDAIKLEAVRKNDSASKIVNEITNLKRLSVGDRKTALLELADKLSHDSPEYIDLDPMLVQTINTFIPLVIQCMRERDNTMDRIFDEDVEFPSGEEFMLSEHAKEEIPDSKLPSHRSTSSVPPKSSPRSPKKLGAKGAQKSRPESPLRSVSKDAQRSRPESPLRSASKDAQRSRPESPLRSVSKDAQRSRPESPLASGEKGALRSRPESPLRSTSKGAQRSRPESPLRSLSKDARRSRSESPQASVSKDARKSRPESPLRSTSKGAQRLRPESPQKSLSKVSSRLGVSQSKDASKYHLSDQTSEEKTSVSSSQIPEAGKRAAKSLMSSSEAAKKPSKHSSQRKGTSLSPQRPSRKPMGMTSSSDTLLDKLVTQPQKQQRSASTEKRSQTGSESDRIPAAAPRRSSVSRELESVLDRIPPLLCDEVLSYVEARLPSSATDLIKDVQDVRARRSNIVLRSISTDKPEKRLNGWMVVRVAEAVEEEAQSRKLAPAQHMSNLERVLKRLESQQRSASTQEQQEALAEAMRILRCRVDVLKLEASASRSSRRRVLASCVETMSQTETVSMSKSSRSKAYDHPSDISGYFFKSDTPMMRDQFAEENSLEKVLSRVPSVIRNEALILIEDRLAEARKSVASDIRTLRQTYTFEQWMRDDLLLPVAGRLIDAIRELEVILNKPAEQHCEELQRVIKDHQAMLAVANDEERVGIQAALRVLNTEYELAKLNDEHSKTCAELSSCQKKIVGLNDENETLLLRYKELQSKVAGEGGKMMSSERSTVSEEGRSSKKMKTCIPSPSKFSGKHRRRSIVSGESKTSDLKRFAEVLDQQCTNWADTEEQCSQEMNHMARRLSQIHDFLAQDRWAQHTYSRMLDQAANGVLNAVLLVRSRVQQRGDEPADVEAEAMMLIERLEDVDSETKEVIVLLVKEKRALQLQIDGLADVNHDLQEQCTLSREAIKDSAGALTVTSQAMDALAGQLEMDRKQNENLATLAPVDSVKLVETVEAELNELQRLALDVEVRGDEKEVRSHVQRMSVLVTQLEDQRQQLQEENEKLKHRHNSLQRRLTDEPILMEPEGDRPVQFQFETRLGAAGNVEGRVMMQKEGVREPVQLDFSMMLAASESGALDEDEAEEEKEDTAAAAAAATESHNVQRPLESVLTSKPKAGSPGRLGRALQRLTKRRKRSPEAVLDSNQNNSWGCSLCVECRAPITATTASIAPWLCAACAGPGATGDFSEFSSVSTLTATDSWDLASAVDHARADSPRPSGVRFHLTSPPRRDRERRHLVSDLVDRVARLSCDGGALRWELADSPPMAAGADSPDSLQAPDGGASLCIPYCQPLAAPRSATVASQRRQRAERRLEAASASLRRSLCRSLAAAAAPTGANLRKPIFFRDIRSNR